jgi:thioredoxin reductase (NADPH)
MAAAPLLDAEDSALFPKMTDAQIDLLARHGEVRAAQAGQVLFGPGNAGYDVMVVLEGSVSVLVGDGEEARELARQGPRDLMVELNVFTGEGTGATGIVLEAGSVLAVPAHAFRELVGRELSFGDLVLQTLFRRRQALERLRLGIRIIGSPFDRDTQRLREFATRNRVLHDWIDLEEPRGRAWLEDLGIGDVSKPVVLLGGRRFLVDPTNAELAAAAGVRNRGAADDTAYDLVVVGAGPAGLAASVYAAAGGLSTCRLDAVAVGGRLPRRDGSRTIWAFPPGYPAPSSRSARCCRPRSSACTSGFPVAPSGSRSATDFT